MRRESAAIVRRFSKAEDGAAAIELAMIAPVLVSAIAAILAFGIYFGTASSVQQLAADAARASIAGMTDSERASIAKNRVSSSASGYVLLDPARTSVNAQPSSTDPTLYSVSVSYDASRMPIWIFEKLIPLPPKTIVRTAMIQRGGY